MIFCNPWIIQLSDTIKTNVYIILFHFNARQFQVAACFAPLEKIRVGTLQCRFLEITANQVNSNASYRASELTKRLNR